MSAASTPRRDRPAPVNLICLLALTGALLAVPCSAADEAEHANSIGLGQGLRLAPVQRGAPSMSFTNGPDEPGMSDGRRAVTTDKSSGQMGLRLFRGSNWLAGDRLSLSLTGNTRSAEGLRWREDNLNGSMVGMPIAPQGLHSGNLNITSELLYSTPITRHLGLGLSIMQRSSGLRDSGVPDERMFSLRFRGEF